MFDSFSFSLAGGDAQGVSFEVVDFEGREEMSSLYEFRIRLATTDATVKLGDLVGQRATLAILGDQTVIPTPPARKIHGILAEAALLGASQGASQGAAQQFFYEVRLVPRLWALTQYRGYRVFGTSQKKKVFEVVSDVLKDANVLQFVEGEDFELRNLATDDYVARDYYSQYGETHFDFISRLMEQAGIFFYFEQGDTAEKLVIGDRQEAFKDIHGGSTTIKYQADLLTGGIVPRSIHAFVGRRHQVPETVILKDYEYDLVNPVMSVEKQVPAATGPLSDGANMQKGSICYFGDYGHPAAQSPDNVAVQQESGASAKSGMNELGTIRANEIGCRQIVFNGHSDREDLFPGGLFTLGNHFRQEMNDSYLVTSITHRGVTPTYAATKLVGKSQDEAGYHNRFDALYGEVTFRPERRTEKPTFTGMMPAIVDTKPGQEIDNRAQPDAIGRYKVRLPFDEGVDDLAAGQASSYLRMSSLSAGAMQGVSFPLLPGVEVIWSCINGDVDRPVICGAVPNRAAPSNVTWENRTQSRIDTPGGIEIVLNDGPGQTSAS